MFGNLSLKVKAGGCSPRKKHGPLMGTNEKVHNENGRVDRDFQKKSYVDGRFSESMS